MVLLAVWSFVAKISRRWEVVLHLPFCARLFARDGSEQAACCLLLWDPARSEVRIGSRGEVRLASLSFVKG